MSERNNKRQARSSLVSDKCSHGICFTDDCGLCEENGLVEMIGWMKPKVTKATSRLKQLRAEKKLKKMKAKQQRAG